MEHPPNGWFDVVIVQPSLTELIPEARGFMRGTVSSVYINVGDTKEWVLHYCAADASTSQIGSVVQLGDARPVSPPYPKVTFAPTASLSSRAKVTFVHGFIDENGIFRDLRLLGEQPDEVHTLLELLTHWEFSPARRGKDAATVEVLLAIPARRNKTL
jgi:hypothetical protein